MLSFLGVISLIISVTFAGDRAGLGEVCGGSPNRIHCKRGLECLYDANECSPNCEGQGFECLGKCGYIVAEKCAKGLCRDNAECLDIPGEGCNNKVCAITTNICCPLDEQVETAGILTMHHYEAGDLSRTGKQCCPSTGHWTARDDKTKTYYCGGYYVGATLLQEFGNVCAHKRCCDPEKEYEFADTGKCPYGYFCCGVTGNWDCIRKRRQRRDDPPHNGPQYSFDKRCERHMESKACEPEE